MPQPSESDFIRWLRSQARISDLARVPIGDDLAVLNWNPRDLLLVGIDQVLDGVHFDSSQHGPREIGAKAMNRNLSDCAAMACLPAAAVVSAALPRGVGLDFAKELYLGLRESADPFECVIVGGDTGSWDGKLALTVAILGRSDGIEPVTRSSAKPGDLIYVTGALGGSILGRHLRFVPRVREARQLAQTGSVTAMLDVSDGLSRDLRNLCESSGVGAEVEADRVPIHPDALERSRVDRVTPLEHALHDGEDHELLFTAARELSGLPFPCTRIGRIVAGDQILLVRSGGAAEPLAPKGWDHAI
jgi:thiamine-monophosphate kinase